jgi:hypothetical protein
LVRYERSIIKKRKGGNVKKFERFAFSLFDLLVFVAIFILVIINLIA